MSDDASLSQFLTPETKALLDFIYDGVYVVDLDRRILFWNRGAELMTGWPKEEVVGRCCRDNILCHIDEAGTLLCQDECPLTRCMAQKKRIEEKVFPRHHSGHRFPTRTHVAPVKDASGKVVGAIEVFRDISSEEQHRVLQEKFDKLIKQYVSKTTYDTVREAASKEGALKAAMKDMTVLFMDVVGFTTLSEKRPPEEVVELLNELFSSCSHVIRQRSGDIDKFIGDCVMAVFIDAQDAVDAARDILGTALPALNQSREARGLPPVRTRIGINSGRLLQGDIGASDRKDLTVIGDVVNTASRVEGAAEPGSFLVSEATYSRLQRPEEFEFAKELTLKGKSAAVRLYRPKA